MGRGQEKSIATIVQSNLSLFDSLLYPAPTPLINPLMHDILSDYPCTTNYLCKLTIYILLLPCHPTRR